MYWLRQMRPAAQTRVVVLGAGYAGMAAFLELQAVQRAWRLALTLVNAGRYHYYTTELHAFAAGTEAETDVRLALRRVVQPPAQLVVGRAARIDPAARRVELVGGEMLPYDYLIAGLGSEPEYFGVPGAREHGLVVGNPGAAADLRRRLATALAAGGPVRLAVAGGGLTGVELAGELADAYGERLVVTLIEATPQIMMGFDPALAELAAEILGEKGVTIRREARIARVQAGALELAGGERLPFDLLVWAGGVRGPGLLAASGLAVTRRGRGVVGNCLQAADHPEIFLVGDAAAFVDPDSGRELPATAQAAVQMGRYASRAVLRRLAGRPLRPFRPHIRGVIATLGGHAAVGEVGGERLTGLPALLVKRALEAHHAYEAGGVVPILRKLVAAVPHLWRRHHGLSLPAPLPPGTARSPVR